MSIVRIGLAETENFAEGYDAIFGKGKKAPAAKKSVKKVAKPKASKAKKKGARKR